jgi:hypothetical protein
MKAVEAQFLLVLRIQKAADAVIREFLKAASGHINGVPKATRSDFSQIYLSSL